MVHRSRWKYQCADNFKKPTGKNPRGEKSETYSPKNFKAPSLFLLEESKYDAIGRKNAFPFFKCEHRNQHGSEERELRASGALSTPTNHHRFFSSQQVATKKSSGKRVLAEERRDRIGYHSLRQRKSADPISVGLKQQQHWREASDISQREIN